MAALTWTKSTTENQWTSNEVTVTGTVNVDIERKSHGDLAVYVKNSSAKRYKLIKVFKGVCDINFNLANDATSATLKAKFVSYSEPENTSYCG